MSQFEKFYTTIILIVVLLLGSVVVKWAWLDSSTGVPAQQQAADIPPELGPSETLVLGATIITVGIIAGMAERMIFGNKESRRKDSPSTAAVPDES